MPASLRTLPLHPPGSCKLKAIFATFAARDTTGMNRRNGGFVLEGQDCLGAPHGSGRWPPKGPWKLGQDICALNGWASSG